VIINKGETFSDIYLVYKEKVYLSLRKKGQNEFLILPQNSMFGDYQIIFNHRATECYTSDESQDTYTMCLKKKTFLDILEKFPDAGVFYR